MIFIRGICGAIIGASAALIVYYGGGWASIPLFLLIVAVAIFATAEFFAKRQHPKSELEEYADAMIIKACCEMTCFSCHRTSHFDGSFGGSIVCGYCGRVFNLVAADSSLGEQIGNDQGKGLPYSIRDMYLVYELPDGSLTSQPWTDLEEAGTLIDPDGGEDLPLVGWSRTEI